MNDATEKKSILERIEEFVDDHFYSCLIGGSVAFYGMMALIVRRILIMSVKNGNPVFVFSLFPEKSKK